MRRSIWTRPVLMAPNAAFAAALVAATIAGCGLAVQAGDLFLITRTGQGKPLTMLVTYDGTITCDGGRGKTLPDRLLLVARDLPGQLQSDAQRNLDLPSPAGSVYRYKVHLQAGTIAFPDTAAAHSSALAQLEQFILQAQPSCGAG